MSDFDPSLSPPDGIREELDVTLFIPCYNEESHITATLETVQSAMGELSYTYEVLVTDDGSRDRTSQVVKEFCTRHPTMPVRLHRNVRNLGLARSFVDAAFRGRGRFYRLICGDNIEPKESMIAILQHLGRADVIVPYYPMVEGKSAFRMAISDCYTSLVNFISGYQLPYYNGNPLYRRYHVMRWASYNYGFGFQADLLCKLLEEQIAYLAQPISGLHREKHRGASALNLRNFLSTGHTLTEIFIRRIRRIIFKN